MIINFNYDDNNEEEEKIAETRLYPKVAAVSRCWK